MIEEQRQRAATILRENRVLVETLRDLLVEHKTIDAKRLKELAPKSAKPQAAPTT
jgi:ATP-dependent Zn protease